MKNVPLSVIIITYNEELNICSALESVVGWANQIFVVDSFSTDKTVEIARQFGVEVVQNYWIDWATQRKWCLENLTFLNEWILFLDADEVVSCELKAEIEKILYNIKSDFKAYYIKRKFIFLGKWLKHGFCASNEEIRLSNRKYLSVESRGGLELYLVKGAVGRLQNYIIHEDKKNIHDWIEKQNIRTSLEARYIYKIKIEKKIPKLDNIYWKVKIKYISYKLPLFIRPFLQFFYGYVIKKGFLDGIEGLVYNFLLGFWYWLMVDIKIIELKRALKRNVE